MIGLYYVKMSKWIPMNIFLATYFIGNEIVDHVFWKRHCAITKKKCLWVQSYFNDLLWFTERLLVQLFIYSSFVTIDYVIFLFKKEKLSVITEALFGEMCRSATASLVARMVNTNFEAQKLRLRQNRPFMSIKSFEQTQQVGRVTR